jgi:hypothetical protein
MCDFRVLLDASVVKHSIRSRTVLKSNGYVYEFVDEDPLANDDCKRLREEIDCLPYLVEYTKSGEMSFLLAPTMISELLRNSSVPSYQGSSILKEADYTVIKEPISVSYAVIPELGQNSRTIESTFLKGIQDPRYLELRKACGANQGQSVRENQLFDAFYIWCAESIDATHFLTTDFKLVNCINNHYKDRPQKVKVTNPSKLLDDLRQATSI